MSRSGLARRPAGMGWGVLAGGGLLAGIGFTMALFIGDLVLPDALIDSAKLGILSASAVSAAAGLAALAACPLAPSSSTRKSVNSFAAR